MRKFDSLWEEKNGVFEVSPGANITDTITEAMARSAKEHRLICFEFNDVFVTVTNASDPALIYRDWQRAMNGYIGKHIGPSPALTLTADEAAADARIEAENEKRRKASADAYQQKADAKRAMTVARLAEAPAMAFRDEASWQTTKAANTDSYGGGVIQFAEQWARLMQLEMSHGAKLVDIADAASSEADTDGITGFMYGCAVSILAKVWAHGEELRQWHNLKTQISTEGERANASGGVLNPALLSIGE